LKRIPWFIIALLLIFSSCRKYNKPQQISEQDYIFGLTPSIEIAYEPTSSVISPFPSPTNTVQPNDGNPILISYSVSVDGGEELTNCITGRDEPIFLLLEDGRLIRFNKQQYMESYLSKEEIQKLMDKIEKTGIYNTNKQDDYGLEQLVIGERKFFPAIPSLPVENVKTLLINYLPEKEERYIPENLMLFTYSFAELPSFQEYPEIEISKRQWSTSLEPLSVLQSGWHKINGKDVITLMNQYNKFPDMLIFKEDDYYYLTAICAINLGAE
jgi:hypothetical protein